MPEVVYLTPVQAAVRGATDEDLRIQALIQSADPSWHLGLPRDHINLIPNPISGRIERAELWPS